jgi:hypothetical protein
MLSTHKALNTFVSDMKRLCGDSFTLYFQTLKMLDDVKHEKSSMHNMATQQSEECKTAHTLEEFLREPQHYVVLE